MSTSEECLIDAQVIVEIGSTRKALGAPCIEYYRACCDIRSACYSDLGAEPSTSYARPDCCGEGHSTYFWAQAGFETYTVDIDESCRDCLARQYAGLGEELPANLHICVPRYGIEFLDGFDDEEIDFLYLDGWDVGTPGFAELHLEAF